MANDSKRGPAAPVAGEPTERSIADCTLALLARRRDGATICPSEVARALAPSDGSHEAWRALMPQVRHVAARMADTGVIQVTQRGVAVDARTARGAIRLRLAAQPRPTPDPATAQAD